MRSEGKIDHDEFQKVRPSRLPKMAMTVDDRTLSETDTQYLLRFNSLKREEKPHIEIVELQDD